MGVPQEDHTRVVSSIFAAVVTVMIPMMAISGAASDQARAPPSPPQPAEVIKTGYIVTAIAKGLDHPWSMAFLPDGSMLVTERVGRLRMIKDGSLLPQPIAGVPAVHTGSQAGLFDVVLH